MVTRIFFFLIIFTSFSFANCTNSINNKENLKKIKIDINNKKKFFTRAARYYVAVNSRGKDVYENAPKYHRQYHRKVKANLSFEMKNGDLCNFKATLRGHGDVSDHFDLVNGVPLSSYRVKLEEGSFNNITRFILFRPKARKYDNEILAATLLKELGFLSPRTFKVKVEINNVSSDYIFQENLKKEFLEDNNRVDGPILEANENLFKFNKLTLARISNKEWIQGKIENYIISLNAMKYYNFHRYANFGFRIKSINFKNSKGLAIDEVIRFDKKNLKLYEYENIGTFQAIMFALEGMHGLSYDDSRFYFNPLNTMIEPIYYDGDVNILSLINYDKTLGKYNSNMEDWKITKDINLDFIDFEKKSFRYNFKNQVITSSARDNALRAVKKLKKLDSSNLLLELKKNGFIDINQNQLNTLIKIINDRLLIISQSKISENIVPEKRIFEKYQKEMGIEKDLELIFYKKFYLKENKKFLLVDYCDLKLLNCVEKEIREKDILNLIEQNNLFKKNNSFMVMKKIEYQNGPNLKFIDEYEKDYKLERKNKSISFLEWLRTKNNDYFEFNNFNNT